MIIIPWIIIMLMLINCLVFAFLPLRYWNATLFKIIMAGLFGMWFVANLYNFISL